MARWTDRHMPASRWVGSIGPFSAELDALLGGIRCAMDGVDDRVGEDADPDPRLAALTDAQLVAMALGVELR